VANHLNRSVCETPLQRARQRRPIALESLQRSRFALPRSRTPGRVGGASSADSKRLQLHPAEPSTDDRHLPASRFQGGGGGRSRPGSASTGPEITQAASGEAAAAPCNARWAASVPPGQENGAVGVAPRFGRDPACGYVRGMSGRPPGEACRRRDSPRARLLAPLAITASTASAGGAVRQAS